LGGGFTDRTLRRALVAIGGKTRKVRPYGFGSWLWYLPDHDFENTEAATSESVESASPPQQAVPTAPDKPGPTLAENLSPSRKFEGSPRETCPLREKTTVPAFELPLRLPPDEPVDVLPAAPPEETRTPRPEQAWTLLMQKCNEDHFILYEYHVAQCKLRRLLNVRSRNRCRTGIFKRVEIDLIKPRTFTHPIHCRDP
jgi:hypothetical protein